MAYDDEDNLFEEEFDFVDDDDDDEEDSELETKNTEAEEVKEKPAPKKKPRTSKPKTRAKSGSKANAASRGKKTTAKANPENDSADGSKDAPKKAEAGEQSPVTGDTVKGDAVEADAEPAKEVAPPSPPTEHVVHLYEFGDFTRTIPREFTEEDSEAFAVEYNRTSTPHSRYAVAAHKDTEAALSISVSLYDPARLS